MWTLSGGGVGVEVLEEVGFVGDLLLGELEGVLFDSALGDGEDFFGLVTSLSKFMSNRLDTELLSECASLSKPLLVAFSFFFAYFSNIDGDRIDVDWTNDNGMAGCFTSLFGRPRPPGVLLRPLVDELVRLDPDVLLLAVVILVEDVGLLVSPSDEPNKPYLADVGLRLVARDDGIPSGFANPSPRRPNRDDTGNAG